MFVMFFTTIFITIVMIVCWELNPLITVTFASFILTIEGFILSAVIFKVPQGGWFTLTIAGFIALIKLTWWTGSQARARSLQRKQMSVGELLALGSSVHGAGITRSTGGVPPIASSDGSGSVEITAHASGENGGGRAAPGPRKFTMLRESKEVVSVIPGIGVYYHDLAGSRPGAAPAVLAQLLQLTCAMHQVSFLVTVRVQPIPHVDVARSILVRPVPDVPNCYSVVARYGYSDIIDHGADFIRIISAIITTQLDHAATKKAPAPAAATVGTPQPMHPTNAWDSDSAHDHDDPMVTAIAAANWTAALENSGFSAGSTLTAALSTGHIVVRA